MRIGVFTAILGDLPFDAALDRVAALGAEAVEVGAGGYPGAQHCDTAALLADAGAARRWREQVASRGLVVSALSAHANPLHPDPGVAAEARDLLDRALAAAELLEVPVVNAFSGCPGDGPGARAPNWVTTPWPQEFADVLAWQWEESALPFWTETAALAKRRGVRVAIEPHPGFLVYNLGTLLRLREAAGGAIAANFDPSHLWWQGADPLEAIRVLAAEGALAHVHAKDTWLNPHVIRRDGVLDTTPRDRIAERAWAFRTVGFGQGEQAWRNLMSALLTAGYDGVVSVEHEDPLLGTEDGLAKALELLLRLRPAPGDADA
jgi:sugar phosphate isomerase/epimerase